MKPALALAETPIPSSWRIALEESLVAFALTFLVLIASAGGASADRADLLTAAIVGGIWFLKTWAEARALKLRLPPEAP